MQGRWDQLWPEHRPDRRWRMITALAESQQVARLLGMRDLPTTLQPLSERALLEILAATICQATEPTRAYPEARLLAGQTPAEIAVDEGLPEPVVVLFEWLFYDIRPFRGARDLLQRIVSDVGVLGTTWQARLLQWLPIVIYGVSAPQLLPDILVAARDLLTRSPTGEPEITSAHEARVLSASELHMLSDLRESTLLQRGWLAARLPPELGPVWTMEQSAQQQLSAVTIAASTKQSMRTVAR